MQTKLPYVTMATSERKEGKKMPERKTSFNPEWWNQFNAITKSSKSDNHAFCSLCHCDVDVSSKGKGAIERHVSSDKHKSSKRAAGTSSLATFFWPAGSPQDDKISATELCKAYHAVKHHQSYRSVDCGVKVDREIFCDSLTAKGMTCGKTKTEALCENVLAPYSVHTHTDYIKENAQWQLMHKTKEQPSVSRSY